MNSAAQINIFDKPVSVFASLAPAADTRPYVRTLGEFLDGGTHYAEQISRARELRASFEVLHSKGDTAGYEEAKRQYNQIKMQLPCCIPQGVCPSAHDNGFISYTDVLCLDIDREKPGKQPNGNELFDLGELKQFFASLDYVAYCGLSVGGLGLFVLIPIESHERHADYWRAIDTMLQKYGISIDKATKNLARKRIMSYDPHAYRNPAAEVFRQLPGEVQHHAQHPHTTQAETLDLDIDTASDADRMRQAAREAVARRIDMTQNYEDWLRLGAAIANTQGESGRELYHDLSALNSSYTAAETDKKYNSLLASNSARGCSYGTFFELCKTYGVAVPKSTRRTHSKSKKYTPRLTQRLAPRPANSCRTAAPPTTTTTATMGAEGVTISPAAKEELRQHSEIMACDIIFLREYMAAHPQTAQFLQDVDAHYCGGAMAGEKDWLMTDEQFNYLLDKKLI